MVYLADPSNVRQVFVNNDTYAQKFSYFYKKLGFIFGERAMGYGLVTNTKLLSWRKRPHIMNPAFYRKCLKNFMTNFNTVSDKFSICMSKIADSNVPVSMVEEFSKVTLEAISQVSFHIDTNSIEDPKSPFSSAIRAYCSAVQANLDIPLNSLLLKIFLFKPFQTASQMEQIAATRFLREFANDCISARMKDTDENKPVPGELLSVLINDGSITREDVIDEFITIYFAGKRQRQTLAFALYEILSNSRIEEKLLRSKKCWVVEKKLNLKTWWNSNRPDRFLRKIYENTQSRSLHHSEYWRRISQLVVIKFQKEARLLRVTFSLPWTQKSGRILKFSTPKDLLIQLASQTLAWFISHFPLALVIALDKRSRSLSPKWSLRDRFKSFNLISYQIKPIEYLEN